MARNETNQHKHDQKIRELANYYYNQGYSVLADHIGWPTTPSIINGYIPDLHIKFYLQEIMIEIETKDSEYNEHSLKQKEAFERWEQSGLYRKFERIIIS